MKKDLHKILECGLASNASEAEKQEMLSLFHEQENEFLLKNELMKQLSVSKSSHLNQQDIDRMFDRLWILIQQKKERPGNMRRILYTVTGTAAALLVGLAIGFLVDNLKGNAAPVYYTAYAPRGSISEVILPDGTDIYLNADSRIRYSMEGANGGREVYLEGEAWFDVASLEDNNFTVYTSYYTVNVTGTKFNVKAYESDNEVITTLEEGKVKVVSGEKCRVNGEIIIEPGEQLILSKETNRLRMQEVNTRWYTSWKENKLIFVNMSLSELELLLERKYGVEIELKSDDLLNLHFDGTIKNESILEILDIIKKTLPISYRISGQKIEITSN